jgi:hypothetical protein
MNMISLAFVRIRFSENKVFGGAPQSLFGPALAILTLAATVASAVEFTSNTSIGAFDTDFDGADIIISNCTVTVDGPHSFDNLRVAAGGTLTHSFWPAGQISITFNVTNEPQVLNGTNPVTLLNTNISTPLVVTDSGQTTAYTNGVDYVQTNLPDGTTQIQRTDTSVIPDGAKVLVSYSWNYIVPAGLNLSVTGDVIIASGGSINANGIGYGPATGPGRGASSGGTYFDGSGAGHGGSGGMSSSHAMGGVCYDTLYQPATMGSGGGASYAGGGGNGGGQVQIVAGGSVTIDGVISANGADGTNSRAGGGAGGGIWITATNVAGSGSIAANGGAGEPVHGGGGGGGRISIQCATNNFSGSMTAYGGTGSNTGGAGTIFTQTVAQNSLLVVDNGGRVTYANSSVSLPAIADVVIRGGGIIFPSGQFSPNNLTIATNGILVGKLQSSLTLSVAGNLNIRAGGAMLFDSTGYLPGGGPAPGIIYTGNSYYPGGGGGHGGYGAAGFVTGANGGATYGSQTAPTSMGSSGGGIWNGSIGGIGGGAVQLNVAGTLQLDGRISANGGSGMGGAGGGAGGSVYIASCTTFAGTGSITANGGNGAGTFGGGGGGGRIAIYAGNNIFTGTISAFGGGGANYGGAGTIFTQFGGVQQLILDNGGRSGTNTLLSSANAANLVVQNGAVGSASSSVTFASLLVTSNAWLTHLPSGSLNLTISNDATIQSGGGFMGDSLGRSGSQGSATGGNVFYSPNSIYVCGGGGYGGKGGNAIANAAAGGVNTYDTAAYPSPAYSGSGGGGAYYMTAVGGSGGGFLQLTVFGTFQLDGLISANGGDGLGEGAGGGAGGGVYLTAGTFAGRGSIRANGGSGANSFGGGGGGGRIAVYAGTNTFAGSLSAFGGGGANYGGGGTIYSTTNAASQAQIIVDNAGHAGANTIWNSSPNTDLILRNGGSCFVSGSVNFGNLTIGTNSWLIVSNGLPSSATIYAADVIVQAGGGISADYAGYNANAGNGRGNGYGASSPYYSCTGAGHGGFGANSSIPSSTYYYGGGGAAYDNAANPIDAGSGGGSYGPSLGGNGGGAITLVLQGNLQLDGALSANGGNGFGTGGGGGSGGSLNISCAALTGSGSISANGGGGVAGIGGGGGGGLIAFNLTSNLFSGPITAYGGGGANYGGAGVIYFKTNTTGQSLVILDNAGQLGAFTPLTGINSGSSIVLRSGAIASTGFQPQIISSLLINSNAWISVSNQSPAINLTVLGGATIQAGGGIAANAFGSPQNTGTGHGTGFGVSPWFQCGGGGHGGYGANGYTNLGAGGMTFDSSTSPSLVGSGGGGINTYSIGGTGGSYVRLTVNGALQLDGCITANGGNGTGVGGGGGAGGSIYLTLNSLAGSGSIAANGGSGANLIGGGGGGGRIAIYFNTNNFNGNISAYGGGGYAYGGAGTIYTRTNSQPYGQLLLDNGGDAGTNTTFDLSSMDVVIQRAAVGMLPAGSSWSPSTLTLRTNGLLTTQASGSPSSINANNVTIDAGGVLAVDGDGYGSQSGPGYGYGNSYGNSNPHGGGGHGGYGGGNLSGWGLAYDSIQSPASAGSGGGNYFYGSPYSYGGNGGGVLSLTVNNTLTVNGRLSANGSDGAYYAGGGAGGSLYLHNINQLNGRGIISANGGSSGGGAAGGGGGGRIAIYCTSNNFTGQISASGGNGLYPGGAGTVFTRFNNGVPTLLVDNGGIAGTNTPLSGTFSMPLPPFDLNISGAASVVPLTPLPLISNLNLATNSTLTMQVAQSNLFIAVQNNANLAGNVTADYLGYPQTNGPGAGVAINSQGSGGGHGGAGGNSASGAPGGAGYGSAAQPVDLGSGGGNGVNTVTGGSEGGGSVRISVGGTLNLDGNVSAAGDFGWQDGSGGGAGGSIWITAAKLSGAGAISATGGDGDLWNGGGGGGGGRIAIYAPTNLFAGSTNVSGGDGAVSGLMGTMFMSGSLLGFQIVLQSPDGIISNAVGYVDLNFNEAVDPASVSANTFALTTPAGTLDSSSLSASAIGVATVRVGFPAQNLPGDYSIQAATTITNLFGVPLASAYAGSFTIVPLTFSGTVSDTNGAPVAGVTVQPDGGLIGALTDTNGNYSLNVPPGWSGTVTPAFGRFMFVPGALAYTNTTSSLAGQNYLMVTTVAPNLASSLSGTNLSLAWAGIPGVTYQTMWSTNLVDWQPLGDPLAGTNGPMQITLPLGADPSAFFRVSATH